MPKKKKLYLKKGFEMYRLLKGWNVRDFAGKMDVSPGTVYFWENQEVSVPSAKARKICALLGKPISELFEIRFKKVVVMEAEDGQR